MVKIVTDSSSDIPADVARELGIAVVPLYVRFGDKSYREGIDIDIDRFYHELEHNPNPPKTSTPSPGDFIQVYQQLAAETDEIVSIHLSSKLSATSNVARLAADYVKDKCQVEVIDSRSASMGLGLIAITAAKAARAGASLDQITETVHQTIPYIHLFGIITNLRYVMREKRLFVPGLWIVLGKVGTKFHAKLYGEVYEGKIRPIGVFLSEGKAFDKLEQRLAAFQIKEMATLYSTLPEWGPEFTRRMNQVPFQGQIYAARYGCMTGIQAGPRAVGVAFIEGDE